MAAAGTRVRPVADAVEALRPQDHLGVPLGPGQPQTLLHALAGRSDWTDLTITGALLIDLYQVFLHPGVHHLSSFFGPAERFLRDAGADVQYVPADLRRLAPLLEVVSPRVMATAATPPDADGWCSLSLHAGATFAELRRAGADPDRLLVVEVEERLPRTFGLDPDHPHRLHVDEVDLLVQGERPPVLLEDPVPGEVERAIAEHVTAFVPDGSTLQTGIGSIPSTVASLLAEGAGGGYGIHSEMFTNGLMRLHQAGKVTNDGKGSFDGFSVTTFAAGTEDLYRWLDGNAEVRFLGADVVNAPEVISRNRSMVSVNGALAVDLLGQVVADSIGGQQFSGVGGHEDFVASSGLQTEDRSLVCLPSTVELDGQVRSRIVAGMPEGSVVTTPRHQLDVVVTEHGVAELRGRTVRQRALALAAIADPAHRAPLQEAAEELR